MNSPEMIPQGSELWLALRAGHATASCFSDILAKSKDLKMRTKLMRKLVAERMTGKPVETYRGPHMERGHEQEPHSRMAYEALTGAIVEEVGFIPHPSVQWCGASPDGLVSSDGGIEAKCVIPTVQIETVLRGGYPPEHVAQVQGNLWVTAREWWDFCSYSPDMPEHLRLYVYRVKRDDKYIETLEAEVRKFLKEVDEQYALLMDKRTLLDQLVASVRNNDPGLQP